MKDLNKGKNNGKNRFKFESNSKRILKLKVKKIQFSGPGTSGLGVAKASDDHSVYLSELEEKMELGKPPFTTSLC